MEKFRFIQGILILISSSLLTTCEIPDFLGKDQQPVYHLAQRCYALQAVENENFVIVDGDRYRLADSGLGGAMKFFLKPTDLGSYMLYDKDGGYFGTRPDGIGRYWSGNPAADWKIKFLEVHGVLPRTGEEVKGVKFTLITKARFLRLRKQGNNLGLEPATGSIFANDAAFDFIEVAGSECKQFPEAGLNAAIAPDFYTPRDPNQPVRGYVDTHAHFGAPRGQGGTTYAGSIFHPYGIEHALGDCAHLHGPDGTFDLLEAGYNGSSSHSTTGYPDFPYWPKNGTVTHILAYYKWIERAYLGGLRLAVTMVTGNESLCQITQAIHPGQGEGDCSGEDEVRIQTDEIKDLQDYVDAQEGGPGKGWFRIVKSPREAREVIARNKLAVILGTEYNAIFDCQVSSDFCTNEYVDAKLDELHDMGIRVVFPVHKHDNAFGGHKAQEGGYGTWMNLTNKLNTSKATHFTDLINPAKYLFKPIGGNYWEYEECPEGVHGATNMASMQKFYDEDFIVSRNMLRDIPVVGPAVAGFFDWIFFNKMQPAPTYEEFDGSFHGCNIRGLQPVGRRLVTKLIEKKMLIDVDHMGFRTLLDTLEILEAHNYSGLISSHGWSEMDRQLDLRRRFMALGGYRTPMPPFAPTAYRRFMEQAEEMREFPYPIGIGIASDIQGTTGQGGGGTVSYPFKSYDGTVTFGPPKTGNKTFDYNDRGMSHYGMFPEWIENVRRGSREAGVEDEAMGILWNSAEAYLQMWERAENGNPHRITLTDIPIRSASDFVEDSFLDVMISDVNPTMDDEDIDSGGGGDHGNDNGTIGGGPATLPQTDEPEEDGPAFLGISLRSFDLKYFVSAGNGGYAVNANSTSLGHYEQFFIMTVDSSPCLRNGSEVVIRTSAGYFWSAKPGGGLTADATALGDSEKFKLTNHTDPIGCITNNDVISLRSSSNKYISANQYGQALVNSGVAGNWQRLLLTVH